MILETRNTSLDLKNLFDLEEIYLFDVLTFLYKLTQKSIIPVHLKKMQKRQKKNQKKKKKIAEKTKIK
jgi:hypothetical protein